MYCTECGRKIETGYEFCPECGTRIEIEEEPTGFESDDNDSGDIFHQKVIAKNAEQNKDFFEETDTIWKNKWAALVLCILFGWLGAHRFYEGKKISGFFYMFTLGAFGLGWLYDIIRLIQQPNPYPAQIRKKKFRG